MNYSSNHVIREINLLIQVNAWMGFDWFRIICHCLNRPLRDCIQVWRVSYDQWYFDRSQLQQWILDELSFRLTLNSIFLNSVKFHLFHSFTGRILLTVEIGPFKFFIQFCWWKSVLVTIMILCYRYSHVNWSLSFLTWNIIICCQQLEHFGLFNIWSIYTAEFWNDQLYFNSHYIDLV